MEASVKEPVGLVNPCGRIAQSDRENVPRLTSLEGTVIGFVDNAKINVERYFSEVADRLRHDFGVRDTISVTKESCSLPASDELLRQLAENCDAVVTGIGD